VRVHPYPGHVGEGRTYEIRTYGCQMNVHDSERVAGLLEDAGYERAPAGSTPDLVVFNTCAVRENAADRLYGNLGHLLPTKKAHQGMQIAVGGCLAQMERQKITDRAPWVDVVYGTHNIGALPKLLERAREREQAQVEFEETLTTFPSLLPARRQSAYSAWVSISVGCNNTCTFCIVPSLRGKERDRRPGDILDEIQALTADGVIEVTLLGQNVNSYGAEFGDRLAFGKLLRACGEIEGLERVRFTSPHPRDFTDDVIEAMRDTPNVMPSLHMPLQSGSDKVLKAMRRAYRRDRYLAILDNVRAHIPQAAITTDIIVGFPGETEEDFAATLDLVRQQSNVDAWDRPAPGPGRSVQQPIPVAVLGILGQRQAAIRADERRPFDDLDLAPTDSFQCPLEGRTEIANLPAATRQNDVLANVLLEFWFDVQQQIEHGLDDRRHDRFAGGPHLLRDIDARRHAVDRHRDDHRLWRLTDEARLFLPLTHHEDGEGGGRIPGTNELHQLCVDRVAGRGQ